MFPLPVLKLPLCQLLVSQQQGPQALGGEPEGGAGSREQGAGSREHGAREHAVGRREQGAGALPIEVLLCLCHLLPLARLQSLQDHIVSPLVVEVVVVEHGTMACAVCPVLVFVKKIVKG